MVKVNIINKKTYFPMSFCSDSIILLGFIPIMLVSIVSLSVINLHDAISGTDPILLWIMITSFVNIFFVVFVSCVYFCLSKKILKFGCVLFITWLFISDTVGGVYLFSNMQHHAYVVGLITFVAQGCNIFFTIFVIKFATCMG